MKIDPEKRGKLPHLESPLPLSGQDGHACGWQVNIPGERPLATPAIADGRLFLGAGFGSFEFYCLDAESGKALWQYQTSDDGPTAAVVADGYVVFNTESCELEVLTADGKQVWKHWLGDPLMSMPAVADGKLFMAYPDSKGDNEHYLACFDIADGRRLWRTPIAGEVITAPVLAGGDVYFATLEGSLYCCRQEDGEVKWREASAATSAPVVVDGQCYFSQRQATRTSADGPPQQTEHCAQRASKPKAETRPYRSTSRTADYLDYGKRRSSSAKRAAMARHDAGVGFAAHKGSGKLYQAMQHLGHANVSGVWSYQGSKPFYWKGRLYASLGDTVHCVPVDSDSALWKRQLSADSSEELVDSVVTPPALANDKVFVGTATGEVYALSAETGEVLWSQAVAGPIDFQLAVVAGRLYVPTRCGRLYCLETGDPEDDGWAMWGASPAHNGSFQAECDVAV